MLREEDTVARLGGDEFVVLVRGCPSSEEAARVGRKLVDAIRDPFFLDGHRCVLSASIGISLFPQHGKDVETLVRRADAAMYRAKQGSGNRCELYEE